MVTDPDFLLEYDQHLGADHGCRKQWRGLRAASRVPARVAVPPTHYHPAQDEYFEIEAGAMVYVVDGMDREVGAGESIQIPRRTSHKARNASSEEQAIVRWETRPALRSEEFFAATARLSGNPLDAALLASEYADVFRLSGPAGLAVPVLALLGRLTGRDQP